MTLNFDRSRALDVICALIAGALFGSLVTLLAVGLS